MREEGGDLPLILKILLCLVAWCHYSSGGVGRGIQ
jgi:hypothetical protein